MARGASSLFMVIKQLARVTSYKSNQWENGIVGLTCNRRTIPVHLVGACSETIDSDNTTLKQVIATTLKTKARLPSRRRALALFSTDMPIRPVLL